MNSSKLPILPTLPTISPEQNDIIKQIELNNNVVIDSVAGSGKTTCNLHIAKHFNNMNILLLTYNAKLKLETREKVFNLNIDNIEVHSYHSFCVKYYDKLCFTDTIINNIIKHKQSPLKQFKYDLIVLDEAQDITSLYYELVCKIYKDNNNNVKICIFGDKKQSIFDFNKADSRYITFATQLFNFNNYKWIKCNLSVSFRITKEMSLFINKCLLKENWITSNKISNNKPRYIICDCFNNYNNFNNFRTFEEVEYYLNLGYKPSDIFILAPSLKSLKTPARSLENKIKTDLPHVMVYVPVSDEETLDAELLQNKLVFSTFHQTKGLERKVVIVFNFDSSYFEYYKKNANPNICPNELYVATTRGIDHLTVFHHSDNNYLKFIDIDNLSKYCYFEYSKITQ
jgi:superfamily I DNA/RNA helicase